MKNPDHLAPSNTRAVPADRAVATQIGLAAAIARFAVAWDEADSTPDLAAYLPESGTSEFRRICLIELIKVDMVNRWGRDEYPRRLADYVAEFPELQSIPLPPDLLYEEFHCLRRKGLPTDRAQHAETAGPAPDTGGYRSTLLASPRAYGTLTGLDVGDRIDDFDLLLNLGSGAFARVFLARQRSMERLVALKISHNHGSEPQMLAQLDHPYIVRVFDKRLLAERDLKLLYMEYVPGGTLLSLLQRAAETEPGLRSGQLLLDVVDEVLGEKGIRPTESEARDAIAALSWPETVAWLGRRLAEALDYAAQRGVLHRDIKPANVLLTVDGVPKLADFNISFSDHIAGASPAAYFGGSLAYMSPEQLEACHPQLPGRAEDLDGRSDIYALGVMLWELLTGRRPFDDETDIGDSATSLERMLAHRRRGIRHSDLDELPLDCPATLRRVLTTCLAPRAADRWASSGELAQQLELCLDARARDLVDPPHGSVRQRLALKPVPVVTTAIIIGQVLALFYLYGHNLTLLNIHLPAAGKPTFTRMVAIVGVSFHVVFPGLIIYLSRNVIAVPWGMRKGRRYSTEFLARTRSDTLACGERTTRITWAGWVLSLIVLGTTVLMVSELSAGLVVNIFTTHLICGAIAAVYPYFLVNYHVVRWYYPSLLLRGTTTAADAEQLGKLARQATRKLLVAALIPPVGAALGTIFLDPSDLRLIIGSVIGLTLGGAIVFALSFALYQTLLRDLEALRRSVSQT
ncbi:serine/threonine-protein kinase [Nocardia anaemiae]|uniref:serine/threonine-protein kinase n=1 Tax=Nocardia anaemiae TaxID=263910 RepID=UPI000B0B203D|nr:serine/threonine-protein kinase [Nocardia anaemiae]